ncbi:uncharacterized protein LOC127661193 isoform X1 [Xyrauchen texanus]|uniref:uncharacterized protein LOC127661193 isoform X1 n=1 Tax=Xyrauchen texanus TaxID=154827 RepID=UPI002241E039|nr:uncharacterized protein LOC127661193 isoform X1 [Xyrauchen texanus]
MASTIERKTLEANEEPVDEVLQMPPSLLTCGGCQQSIGDRFFLKAIEQYWHEDCLSCDLCGCRLGEVGRRLYYKLGRKLCRRDYLSFQSAFIPVSLISLIRSPPSTLPHSSLVLSGRRASPPLSLGRGVPSAPSAGRSSPSTWMREGTRGGKPKKKVAPTRHNGDRAKLTKKI